MTIFGTTLDKELCIFAVVMWTICGAAMYGLFYPNIHRALQKIFISFCGGPGVWIGWMLVWFFRWLFAK